MCLCSIISLCLSLTLSHSHFCFHICPPSLSLYYLPLSALFHLHLPPRPSICLHCVIFYFNLPPSFTLTFSKAIFFTLLSTSHSLYYLLLSALFHLNLLYHVYTRMLFSFTLPPSFTLTFSKSIFFTHLSPLSHSRLSPFVNLFIFDH